MRIFEAKQKIFPKTEKGISDSIKFTNGKLQKGIDAKIRYEKIGKLWKIIVFYNK